MPQFYHNVHQLSLFAPTTKVCPQCSVEKPLEEFYKESRNPDGRRKECITCRYIREGKDPASRTPIAEFRLPVGATHKVCNRCKEDKAVEAFPKNGASGDGYKSICKKCDYATTKATRDANKEHHRAQSHASYVRNIEHIQAYREANKEHRRQRAHDRQSDPAFRQRMREYMPHYMAEHPEQREKMREYNRKWHAKHPTRRTQYTMHYNARKKAAYVEEVDYARIRERDGDFCYICEKTILPHHAIDFDHRIPLTRHGPHSESNIFTTHAVCNRRKQNKLLEEMTPFQRRGPSDC